MERFEERRDQRRKSLGRKPHCAPARVDPRFGLYSAIVVTVVASILGSSSHLINGPTNAISLVAFSALAFFDPEARLDIYQRMFLLGIMVGVLSARRRPD